MTNRKKRLEKGIDSLEKQIILHLDKKEKANAEGKIELVSYYEREIAAKKRDMAKKQKQREK